MSLDVTLLTGDDTGSGDISFNITHNTGILARQVGLYDLLWGKYGQGLPAKNIRAVDLIYPLSLSLLLMENQKFAETAGEHGDWGTQDQFKDFVERLLKACKENLKAPVLISI